MKIQTILVAVAWSFIISSIVLQVLYVTPGLSWPYIVLLMLGSFLSGILIVDLKDVILSYFFVLPSSLFTMTFVLGILPSITGKLQTGFMTSDLVISSAFTLVMKNTFPIVWVLCLLAGVIGGGVGERIEPLAELTAEDSH
ncbi:hypothetical protein MUO69_06260 [Candidatus Bathyarchaeota archaeon]|jgi:hypothetical protein|nr:hypothetical protein [Candidatus Bathyarchaeota archaeon]